MTEPAAAPAAPASTPSNGAAAPPPRVHAGENFEDFKSQVSARADHLKPLAKVQPPAAPPEQKAETPPAKPPEPAPQNPSDTPDTPPVETPPDAPDPAALQALTKADLELLAKAKAWLESDEMPEEFLQRLVQLKNGEEIEYEPWEEVRQGRMRQRDYTRAMQQHQQEKQQWDADRGFYEQHFAAIFDDENDGAKGGEAMYEIYTRAGKRKQLLALGRRLAREEQSNIDAANGVGYAVMTRLGIKDPNDYRVQQAVQREYARRNAELDRDARARAMAMENEQLRKQTEARKQETESQAFFDGQRKSLEQLRPRAFAAVGLNHDDPVHRQDFNTYLDAVIRQENAKKLTPELVLKAARAAREEVEVRRKKQAGDPAKPAPKAGFQPQLGVGGGAPKGAQPTSWHADSFAEKFLPRWAPAKG